MIVMMMAITPSLNASSLFFPIIFPAELVLYDVRNF
jgi:hypothetical protein